MASKCQDAKETLTVFILVNSSMDKDMGKANGSGIMDNIMKENGNLVLKMDMESGNLQKAILMKGNGF